MKRLIHPALLLAIMFCAGAAFSQSAAIPAFPGAEGYGSTTPGGRGGRVIEVTNLGDDGSGSLRAACEAKGPRIIIFRVGGAIRLKKDLVVTEPFATIAGQTAPGDGITIRDATFVVGAHDVIIRGMQFRAGDDPKGTYPEVRDSLCIGRYGDAGVFNVIVDHCSASWGIDENMSTVSPAHDITIQWCINSEALWESIHPKGPHSKGFLVHDGSKRVTIHHNLFAHNSTRNPLLKGGTVTEVINNVVYNWGTEGIALSDPEGSGPYRANIIGNYLIAGDQLWCPAEIILDSAKPGSGVYIRGNIGPKRPDHARSDLDCVHFSSDKFREYVTDEPAIEPSGVTEQEAQAARDLVLANAGARAPELGAIDRRVVQTVLDRTGELIDWPGDVGGWPELNSGPAPLDSDHDGMPDDWETAHHLNPADPADGSAFAPSGYTWVEEYINSLVPTVK